MSRISKVDMNRKVLSHPHARKFPVSFFGYDTHIFTRTVHYDDKREFIPELVVITDEMITTDGKGIPPFETYQIDMDYEISDDSFAALFVPYDSVLLVDTTIQDRQAHIIYHHFLTADKSKYLFSPMYILWKPEYIEYCNIVEVLKDRFEDLEVKL